MNKRITFVSLLLLLLLVPAVLSHESETHDNMCHAPHNPHANLLQRPAGYNGWWCDSHDDWVNGYWAHQRLSQNRNPRQYTGRGENRRNVIYDPQHRGSSQTSSDCAALRADIERQKTLWEGTYTTYIHRNENLVRRVASCAQRVANGWDMPRQCSTWGNPGNGCNYSNTESGCIVACTGG